MRHHSSASFAWWWEDRLSGCGNSYRIHRDGELGKTAASQFCFPGEAVFWVGNRREDGMASEVVH